MNEICWNDGSSSVFFNDDMAESMGKKYGFDPSFLSFGEIELSDDFGIVGWVIPATMN